MERAYRLALTDRKVAPHLRAVVRSIVRPEEGATVATLRGIRAFSFRRIVFAFVAVLWCLCPAVAFAQAGLPYIDEADKSDALEPQPERGTDQAGAEEPSEGETSPESESDPGLTGETVEPEAMPLQEDDTEPAPTDLGDGTPEAPETEDAKSPAPRSNGVPAQAILDLWAQRRAALEQRAERKAQDLLEDLVAQKRKAGWPNFVSIGRVVAIEADRLRANGDLDNAEVRASLATELAPEHAGVWWSAGNVAFARGEYGRAGRRWMGGVGASFADPVTRRLRIASTIVAVLFALAVVALLFAAISIYRHFGAMRFGLLTALRASRGQATLLLALAYGLPLLAGLGPAVTLVIWVSLPALCYSLQERIGAATLIVLFLALPWSTPWLLHPLGYVGSHAHDIYRAATDGAALDAEARLEWNAPHDANEMLVLGMRRYWSGNDEEALLWLERATRAGMDFPDLDVVKGNVLFSRGDADGAIERYEAATSADPENVEALFNLSRVYFFLAEHQKAGEVYRKASDLDYDNVEDFAEASKREGPTFVVRPELPSWATRPDLETTPGRALAAEEAWMLLGGRFSPASYGALAGGGLLVVLFGFMLKPKKQHQPNMRNKRPLERIRREIEVHKHEARLARMRRISAFVVTGSGQLLSGRSVVGLFFMFAFGACAALALGAAGIVPTLLSFDGVPAAWSVALSSTSAAAFHLLAVWESLRNDS